jgi:outer membrane protein OmpA-like peptidoglycan-associated protein
MIYKNGLLYISNKPINSIKASYNRVYWAKDSIVNTTNSSLYTNAPKDTSIKDKRKRFSDDYTARTSNDNNILLGYKKIKENLNEVEQAFINFSTEQVFAYDDSNHLLVYAEKSTKKINGVKHWELWQANLINGRLRNKQRIDFNDKDADYLHPFINEKSDKLYFTSNRKVGKGGYDIFYVSIKNGIIGKQPIAIDQLNSSFDDIMPSVKNDTIYYSSNRLGGLGGFDAYAYSKINGLADIKNLGYPVNSDGDDVGVKLVGDNFYLTSNRNGNFDILKLKYQPKNYTIMGVLAFNADNTILPNQSIYIKDKEFDKLIDTIETDITGKYVFNGKPNRIYEISTINGNGVVERFPVFTSYNDSVAQRSNSAQAQNIIKYDFPIKLGGTSIKQKADSVKLYIVKENKRIEDSLLSISVNQKFVVHYGFNKHVIIKNEQLVLDSLLQKIKQSPNSYIIIGAFTDCIGSYKYNLQLSNKRGESVVAYLTKHGVDRKRIIFTGYSKKFNISPCLTKYGKRNTTLQQDSRRSEIVLSDMKQTNWATLEKQRGPNYYSVYNAKNIAKKTVPVVVKKDTLTKAVVVKPVVKKDTVAKVIFPVVVKKDSAVVKVIPRVVVKKDTITKAVVVKPVVKKDTVAKVILPVVVKKDSAVVKVIPRVVIKKDTITKAVVVKPVVKKDTVARVILPVVVKKDSAVVKVIPRVVVKKDTITKAVVVKPLVKKDTVARVVAVKPIVKKDTMANSPIVVTQAMQVENDDISKEEIIKALDSLAKLKREQERIVAYLTMRINNKPIEIYVSSDSVTIELYDNGIHDKDSVSVIYNNRIVVDKKELKVNNPIKFKLRVDKNKKNNELILVADNLGTEPPNTAVMFITEKSGRRQQVLLNTDLTHNSVVYFIRISNQ